MPYFLSLISLFLTLFLASSNTNNVLLPYFTSDDIQKIINNPEIQHKKINFFINLLWNDPLHYNALVNKLDKEHLFNTRPNRSLLLYKNHLSDIGKTLFTPEAKNNIVSSNNLTIENLFKILSYAYPLIGIRECPCSCPYTRTSYCTIRYEFENTIEHFITTTLQYTTTNIHIITFADPFLMTTLRSIRNFSPDDFKRLSFSAIDFFYKKNTSFLDQQKFCLLKQGLNHILHSLGTTIQTTPFYFYENIHQFKNNFTPSLNTTYLILGIDLEGPSAKDDHTIEDFLDLCNFIPESSCIVATRNKNTKNFIIITQRSNLDSLWHS